jgi:hypothetical protein
MLLSGIHDFSHLQDRFPPRSVAGMTELGVLQLPPGRKTELKTGLYDISPAFDRPIDAGDRFVLLGEASKLFELRNHVENVVKRKK